MSVRVAVIGAGIMGADHARIIASDIPGATLQVVCDADAARAKTVADATGAADAMTDPLAAIARPDIDAVLIASPDQTHRPLSLAAIVAGKPALCEKPLATTSPECLEIVASETNAGRKLVQVGFMRRFDPAYVEMKATLAYGRIGAAMMFHCIHRNVAAPDWFTPDMAITNSAPHEFDIARFVLGDDPATISAHQPGTKTGAPVFMVLATRQKRLVDIEVNVNAAYGYDVRGEVVGETGTVSLRAPVNSEINTALTQATAWPKDWRPRFADAYRLQNQAWIRAIHGGGAVADGAADAWDGYMATLTGECGVRALAAGAPVAIEPAARPSLYARAHGG